jgi:hypothetical protein
VPAPGQRLEQPPCIRMVRVVEDRPRACLFHLFAGVHDQYAVGHLSNDTEIVGDYDHGHVEFGLETSEQVKHLGLDGDVERGRGLVGDEQRRVEGDRHGDHGSLAHTAGELVRVIVNATFGGRDPDEVQELDGPLSRRSAGHRVVRSDRFYDLPAHPVQRVEAGRWVLKDHGDLGTEDALPPAFRHSQEILSQEPGHARDGRPGHETDDRLERRALAGTGLAHHTQCLTSVDMEIQPSYGFQGAVGGFERHAKPLDLKKRLWFPR